jgi:hypothetical protein
MTSPRATDGTREETAPGMWLTRRANSLHPSPRAARHVRRSHRAITATQGAHFTTITFVPPACTPLRQASGTDGLSDAVAILLICLLPLLPALLYEPVPLPPLPRPAHAAVLPISRPLLLSYSAPRPKRRASRYTSPSNPRRISSDRLLVESYQRPASAGRT